MNVEQRPIHLLQDYKGFDAQALDSTNVYLPKQNLKNETETNNWSATTCKYGGNKRPSPQPNINENLKIQAIISQL